MGRSWEVSDESGMEPGLVLFAGGAAEGLVGG